MRTDAVAREISVWREKKLTGSRRPAAGVLRSAGKTAHRTRRSGFQRRLRFPAKPATVCSMRIKNAVQIISESREAVPVPAGRRNVRVSAVKNNRRYRKRGGPVAGSLFFFRKMDLLSRILWFRENFCLYSGRDGRTIKSGSVKKGRGKKG